MTLRGPASLDPERHGTHDFDSGQERLDTWLRAYAGQGQRRDASRTFVLAGEDGRVVGYYTLIATVIDHGDATPEVRRGMSMRFPIPAALLARLAVDRRWQGRGLGSGLLADAIRRAVRAGESVGVRALLVEATDTDAAAFYRRFGLRSSPLDGLTLMATIAELRCATPRRGDR